jgi:NADH oxidase (H2O2-forming)
LTGEKNIVIIGCGAGGGTAAQFARKTDRNAKITIFEKGKYPQYSKCGLPYVISGQIKEFNDLIEFSADWFKKNQIDLFLETTVEKIDLKNKIIYAKKSNEQIKKEFDFLIIATGATPTIPPIENIEKNGKLINGIYTLRTIEDGKQIVSAINKGKKVLIVGAGLIGLEMAGSLYNKEMEVTIIEFLPDILSNILDKDMITPILSRLSEKSKLYTNHKLIKIEEKNGKLEKVYFKDNKTNEQKELMTDLILIATGVKPNVSIAKSIGCKIGKHGGIIVNEKAETSIKNVYAVGDCTEFIDFITKKPIPIGLGSIAVRQGIAAGINCSGGEYHLPKGVLQTCTSSFSGVEIASVGIFNEEFITGKYNGSSLPNYFPGGKPISIKVFADNNGTILGAQAVGSNASKRIDTFACAIISGVNIDDFRKLETAYAPPIAPTLNAMTLACDIISKKLSLKRKK